MKPSNVCQNLRTKKMFIPAQAEELYAQAEQDQGSPHCWCNRTMAEVGPDDRQVSLKLCSPGRPCFEE